MSTRSELGPPPHLGYTASLIDRAADRRIDDALLAKFAKDPRAGAYVIGGEQVVAVHHGLEIARMVGPYMELLRNPGCEASR